MKVLLVEDDANIRRMTIGLLRRMFDRVDPWCAESADQAIEHLRNAAVEVPFDLVISDFNLLGARTGGDVLEWIQIHASYLEQRFLFLTSDERAQALHSLFLLKPCDASTMRTVIEKIVSRS